MTTKSIDDIYREDWHRHIKRKFDLSLGTFAEFKMIDDRTDWDERRSCESVTQYKVNSIYKRGNRTAVG